MNIIESLKIRGNWTPDFSDLRRRKYILLFVYDELKRNGFQNPLLKNSGAKYLGEGKTSTDNYKLKYDRGPIAFKDNLKSSASRGYLLGEIFAVKPEVILYLDANKQNGIVFNRIKKPILMFDQHYNTNSGAKRINSLCYFYVGNEEYYENKNDLRSAMRSFDTTTKTGSYRHNISYGSLFDNSPWKDNDHLWGDY